MVDTILDPNTPITTGIIDVASYEAGGDLNAAVISGVHAIFAKPTQGKDFHDKSFPKFMQESRAIQNAGTPLLIGAYHFGSNSIGGDVQADFFMDSVAPFGQDILLALDLERNPDLRGGTMSVDNARAFVQRVKDRTGRWPVLYSGASFLRDYFHTEKDTIGCCPLWIAQYGEEPHNIAAAWPTYWLWQYTNGHQGPADQVRYPRLTPGFGKIDRSVFRGDLATLTVGWNNLGKVVV